MAILEGTAYWASIKTPNTTFEPVYTGNLVVEGDTLTVQAENLNVNDNIIELNYGETGAGVSLRYAGIQIDRGSETPASFFYDENDDTFNTRWIEIKKRLRNGPVVLETMMVDYKSLERFSDMAPSHLDKTEIIRKINSLV